MTVSEIFYDEVRKATAASMAAQNKFEYDKREVQRLGSSSFSLFDSDSGRLMNEFARKLKSTADDYFTSIQALVLNLDSVCRPLLVDLPEKAAVKKVYETIKQLNEDSEIIIDISAAFDDIDLGGVLNTSYTAPTGSRMIEKMWLIEAQSDKYPLANGNTKVLAGKEENGNQNTNSINRNSGATHQKNPSDLEKEKKEAEKKLKEERDALLKSREAFIKENTKKEEEKYSKEFDTLYKEYEKEYKPLKDKMKQNESLIESKNKELQSLGMFSIFKKKDCRNTIAELEAENQEIKSKISVLNEQHSSKCDVLNTNKNNAISEIKFKAAKKYMLPEEVGLSDEELRMSENERIKYLIVNRILDYRIPMTVKDITEEVQKTYPDVSIIKVSALMRQLNNDAIRVNRKDVGTTSYFTLA